MLLTSTVISEAKKWLGCTETSSNRSVCVNQIKELYGILPNTDPYCAVFVWMCVNEASKRLGIETPLTRTPSTLQMLAASKSKLPVDSTPNKGAIFFYPTSTGGHVGFVTGVSGNKFYTIEGNTTSPVKGEPEGVYEKTRTIGDKQYQFIHLESLDTLENNINSFLSPFGFEIGSFRFNAGVATILVGLGFLFGYNKLKKK